MFWLPALLLFSDALFEEARSGAQQYVAQLPNFLCRQTTYREVRPLREPDWQLSDILSAEVAFESGKEDYRWMLHNGVPVDSMEGVRKLGATSRGEWGSALVSVFHPARQPAFGATAAFQRGVFIGRSYTLLVSVQNSAWELVVNNRMWRPSYEAVVEIDERLRRAVRIEMRARDLPPDFPLASAVMSVEFGVVTIQGQSYLLPVRSVSEICTRGDGRCMRNTIEFFGHRKFQASSRLISEDNPSLSSLTDRVLSRVLQAEHGRFAQAEGREFVRQYLEGESRLGENATLTGGSTEKIRVRKGKEVSEQKDSKQPASCAAYLDALAELFHADSQAEFTEGGLYLREPVEVRIYFFSVAAEHSRLKINYESGKVAVAYTGALLVETASGRVHTFSLRTADLPPALGVFRVQKAVLFQPNPRVYRKEALPAQVTDLFWHDDKTALMQETRYTAPSGKR